MAGPRVGDPAPDFDLPGSGGMRYALGDYEESGVILAFYPADFTTVCTKQFCSYRDERERIEALGVPMLGISPQSVASHERFIEEKGLNVPLLSDRDKSVARAYGVLGLGGVVRRAIFIIDGDLVIRHRDVKRFGVSYESVTDIERALTAIP